MIGRRKSSVVEAETAQTDIRAGLSEIRGSVFKGGQSALEQGEVAQMLKRRVSQASRTIEAGAFIGGHPEIAAAVGGASALAEASLDVATAERRHQAAKGFDQALHEGDLAPNTSDPLANATRAAAESQMQKAKTGIGEASKDAVLNVVNAGVAGSGADVAAHIVSSAPGLIRNTQSFLGGTATMMTDLSQTVIPENKHIPDQGIREALANELQGKVVSEVQDKLMNSTKKPAVTARGEAAVRIADIGRIKEAQESAARRGADADKTDKKGNGTLNKTLPSEIAANRREAVAKQRNRRASVTSKDHEHHRDSDGGGSPRPRSSTRS